jgi:hypothetical protein
VAAAKNEVEPSVLIQVFHNKRTAWVHLREISLR